jgi:TM2 domain-containing membrane protein YozV
VSAREAELEEESLRVAVRALSDDQRRRFYDIANPRLRDPDTYAALNWSLLAGMHHFYLGRWLRGSATLLCFIGGVAALFSDALRWPAALVLVVILVIELAELFRSQTIVQNHNNRMMGRVLEELGQRSR